MKDKTDLQVAQFEEIDFSKSWASAENGDAVRDEFFISSGSSILEPERMAIIVASETDPDDLGLDPNMVPLEDPNKIAEENIEVASEEASYDFEDAVSAEIEEVVAEETSEEVPVASEITYSSIEDNGTVSVTYESTGTEETVLPDDELAEVIAKISELSESTMAFSMCEEAYEAIGEPEFYAEPEFYVEPEVYAEPEASAIVEEPIFDESVEAVQDKLVEEVMSELVEEMECSEDFAPELLYVEETIDAVDEPIIAVDESTDLAEESAEMPEESIEMQEEQLPEDRQPQEQTQQEQPQEQTQQEDQPQEAEEQSGAVVIPFREKKRLQREQKEQELLDEKLRREAEFQKQLIESEEEALKKLRKHRVSSSILNAITMVSSAVFFICLLEISWYYIKSFQYQQDMNQLLDGMQGGIAGDILDQDPITQDNGDILIFPDEGDYDIMESTDKFDKELGDAWLSKYQYLSEMNPDCIGYIEIPNSPISLPVMFTPDDYDKYLYKNFSGEKETRGTPFLDAATKIGKSQNYIIYAHNMADDMAFGSLDKYLSKSYYKENKYIYFNTAVSEGIYEIMAVCKTKIFYKTDECFKYYKYGGELTKDEFKTYVSEVKKMSEYNTGVDAKWGDELITLSTCNKYTENGRLIVVAKRIK